MPKLFLKLSQSLSLLSLLDRREMFRQSRTVTKEKDVTEGMGGVFSGINHLIHKGKHQMYFSVLENP